MKANTGMVTGMKSQKSSPAIEGWIGSSCA